MKKTIVSLHLTFWLLGLCELTQAQILKPVAWSYAAKRTGADAATIYFKATIDRGWHIYSTAQKPGGPLKTSFKFSPSSDFVLSGGIIEPKPISKYEEVYDMEVLSYENSVVFQQGVKLKSKTAVVSGQLVFMVCNDEKCLNPEVMKFIIPVK